jgi:hypothetical protein
MSEPSESNSLELRIAFHNAVSRFQDWTAGIAESKVKFHGRFWPISEVCREVGKLSDPLPEAVLSVLYKETKPGGDVLALKMDKTYRGASRHLLRLIDRRRDEIRQRKTQKSSTQSPVRATTIVTTRSDASRPPVTIDRDQREGPVRCIF